MPADRRQARAPPRHSPARPNAGCDPISPWLDRMISRGERALLQGARVIITGESGVGKTEIARHLHNFVANGVDPFIAVNCAAIPESLFESELFGYEKGAFTGASTEGKKGLIEAA
ncbi:MAG: AAA family ATPase, partial [Rhodobacteraceae bacterium]